MSYLWGGWPTRNEMEGADSHTPKNLIFMKRVLFFLEYCFFRIFTFLLCLIPLRVCYKLANILGIFASRVLRIRQKTMMQNLRLAFGHEKTEAELLRIAEQSMQNLIKLVCEFVRTPEAGQNPTRYIETPDMKCLNEMVSKKKGVVAIVSHFGNWEWLAIPVRPFGLFSNAVGRPLKNPFVYRYVLKMREAANLKNIEKTGAVRASLPVLKRNEILSILIDQHERQGAVWVDFFGRKASTSAFPALLALKYDAPVIPAFFYRNENGVSSVKYGPMFPLIKTGNLQADLLANTQQYVAKIEEEIKKRPGDWLWAHRRWRKPPALKEETSQTF